VLVCSVIGLAAAPTAAEAAVTSVTVDTSRPYENHAGYTYTEITVHGSVSRDDGTVGNYTVPAIVIYPDHGGNGVGIIDWINNAFYHFFPPSTEFGTFQFTLLSTDKYLFDQGYTYMSIQWDKMVTGIWGAAPPNDGQPHNHMVYGTIDKSADAWTILVDAARFLKNPITIGARPVHKAFSSGYSMGAGGQLQLIALNQDPTRVYDGHLITMIGDTCFERNDTPPHYGFFVPCGAFPASHAPVITLISATDMLWPGAFGVVLPASFIRNPGDPLWRQYEMGVTSHIPRPILDLGVPNQDNAEVRPMFRAAVRNLVLWSTFHIPPPASKYYEGSVDGSNNFVPVLDADGNWAGGVRMPFVSSTVAGKPAGAPLGVHTPLNFDAASNVFGFLGGTFTRFSDAELAARYPTRAKYVKLVAIAATADFLGGYITVDDAAGFIQQALVEPLPIPNHGYVGEIDDADDSGNVSGGCSTTGGAGGGLIVMVGLFFVSRRRRQ